MPKILHTIASILEKETTTFKRLIGITGYTNGEYVMTYMHDSVKLNVEVKNEKEMTNYLQQFMSE